MSRPKLLKPAGWVLFLIVVVSLCGCTTVARSSYSAAQARGADVEGFDEIRVFADAPPDSLRNVKGWTPTTRSKDINLLALSGGGSGGAFSVGVLYAWSKRGDRPEFDVVTGVSTGALIAPFAFLGKNHDGELEDLYLGGKADTLVDVNWQTAGIFGASFLKGNAIRAMVEREITPRLLEEVAVEHRKGRRLFVVTTNLDSQRGVIWNMGAIADSKRPDALPLFRNALLASASIPGVFPAVMIKAKAGNAMIEEMHSDGGTSMQFFTLPEDALTAPQVKLPGSKRFHIYVIVNNALIPEFDVVRNKALTVMGRAHAVLVKSQTRQGLQALYNFAQRSGSDLKIASIDRQVTYSMLDPFNRIYMHQVFSIGYSSMMAGTVWKARPTFE